MHCTIDSFIMKRFESHNLLWLLVLSGAGILWFFFRMSGGHVSIPPAGDIFTFIILAPLAEELFFRGVVQDFLKKRLSGALFMISFANIAASVIFAAAHVPFWGFPHAVLVFIPSLAFGFMYDRTGTLVYPVILHTIYNFNIFIV